MADTMADTPRNAERDTLAAVREAMALFDSAETWPKLRQALNEADLTDRLGADGLQRLADLWRGRRTRALDDAALISDLTFWADGGDLPDHPDGFEAPLPADLVAEARRRDWFVRALDSGGWVVNAPDGRPISVPARR